MIQYVDFSCGKDAVAQGKILGAKIQKGEALPKAKCPPCPAARRLALEEPHLHKENQVLSQAPKVCGAVDSNGNIQTEANLNNFSTLQGMKDHGWKFFEWKETSHQFKPDIHNPVGQQQDILPGAYWGWSYPGHGHISLTLKGSGIIHVNAGNANENGHVNVRLDDNFLAAFGYNRRQNTVMGAFHDGSVLTFSEKGQAIMMINYVSPFGMIKKLLM